MNAVNDKVIVRVEMEQKERMLIGGKVMQTGNAFEVNYREKSPVVAEVVSGNQFLKDGEFIVCHHNLFYSPSPFYLYDDLFSIPATHTIFATISEDGELSPVYGNILCDRVYEETLLPIPVELRKFSLNRLTVKKGGWTKYKEGQLIFHRNSAGYEIVYNWDGIEKRATKVHEQMICGYAHKKKAP